MSAKGHTIKHSLQTNWGELYLATVEHDESPMHHRECRRAKVKQRPRCLGGKASHIALLAETFDRVYKLVDSLDCIKMQSQIQAQQVAAGIESLNACSCVIADGSCCKTIQH